MAMTMESPVDIGDEARFYYGGFKLNHHTSENPCGIGLMTSERDRLVGVRQNGSEPGLIMTRPIPTANSRLTINAKIKGKITAELRTDDNKPIPGFLFADSLPATQSGFATAIKWKDGGLAQIKQDYVRIVFRLENAELFTFSLN
jgi:hypothetical protein